MGGADGWCWWVVEGVEELGVGGNSAVGCMEWRGGKCVGWEGGEVWMKGGECFFFSSRRRHTRSSAVSGARSCV